MRSVRGPGPTGFRNIPRSAQGLCRAIIRNASTPMAVRHAPSLDLTSRYAYSAQHVLGALSHTVQHGDWHPPGRSRWGFGRVGSWLWRTHMTAIHGLKWHRIKPKQFWPSLVATVILTAAIPQAALLIASLATLTAMRLMMPPTDLDSQCDWKFGFTEGPARSRQNLPGYNTPTSGNAVLL